MPNARIRLCLLEARAYSTRLLVHVWNYDTVRVIEDARVLSKDPWSLSSICEIHLVASEVERDTILCLQLTLIIIASFGMFQALGPDD